MKRFSSFIVAMGVIALASAPALATTTGITALDSGINGVVTIVKAIFFVVALVLLVMVGVEFAGHRNFGKMAGELAGSAVAILIGANASAILSFLGFSGSLLR